MAYSVEQQELYLDGGRSLSGSRRSSVSSLDSVLTESSDVADDGLACSESTGGTPFFPPPASDVDAPSVTSGSEADRHGRKKKRRRIGRKLRLQGKRSAASFEKAVSITCEVGDLTTSTKFPFERRVYRHEELEPLGIRTVKWDGRLACSICPILTAAAYRWLQRRRSSPDSIWDTPRPPLRQTSRFRLGYEDGEPGARDGQGEAGDWPGRRGDRPPSRAVPLHQHRPFPGERLQGFCGLYFASTSSDAFPQRPGELKVGSAAAKQAVAALRSHPSLVSLSGYVTSKFSVLCPSRLSAECCSQARCPPTPRP